MTEKEWIDSASYADLLERWRFGSTLDPISHGATGSYYAEKMNEKGIAMGSTARVAVSKQVGWSR